MLKISPSAWSVSSFHSMTGRPGNPISQHRWPHGSWQHGWKRMLLPANRGCRQSSWAVIPGTAAWKAVTFSVCVWGSVLVPADSELCHNSSNSLDVHHPQPDRKCSSGWTNTLCWCLSPTGIRLHWHMQANCQARGAPCRLDSCHNTNIQPNHGLTRGKWEKRHKIIVLPSSSLLLILNLKQW